MGELPLIWINDRYKTIREIHGGNLSNVYLCLDYGSDEKVEVIIKTFDFGDIDKGEFHTKLFFREVENLENLYHPGIIKLIDKGKDEDNKIYYIVIDYFESETLDKLIHRRTLSEKQKHNIILKIIEVMIYAHSKQVIHRDLKPSNILINDLYEIKVIDFGTSKIKNSLYSDYTVANLVTPKYASLEQKSFKSIDLRTDIYSLGIIAFELFAATIIPSESDLKKNIEKHTEISSNIKEILLKMINNEPDLRYGTMGEVRDVFKKEFKKLVKGPIYGISFTNTAMNNLHKFGYIINPTSRSEATKIIYEDIVKSKTYIEYDTSGSNETQPVYKLYGKQFEYRCVVDNMTGSTFTIKSILFRNIVTHEGKKERAVLINDEWDVCPTIHHDVNCFDDVNVLLEQVEEYRRLYQIREKDDFAEKSSIERWQQVLRLYSQSLEESRNTLSYVGFEQDVFAERIWVELSSSVDTVLFTDEQLLSMTSRNNINKTKAAGYCVDYHENKLIIQLEKNADSNDFAQSGEISVDQRMVETALNRQKRALKAVQFKELENNELAEILFNPSKAQASKIVQDITYLSELDSSKKEAIEKALNAKDIFLLQGPPGTGKTTFISELVYQINKENPDSKILISSQSNVAVDHALNKIKSIIPSVPILRIGRRDKMSLGAERFTIEEQLEGWFEEIKNLCYAFLEEYKKMIGIDDNLVKQLQITMEINYIESRLKEIHFLNIENSKKAEQIKDRYDSLKILVEQIQKSAAIIQSKTEKVSESEILQIISNFKNRMLETSDNFVKQLDQALSLSEHKETLEMEAESLVIEESKLDNQLVNLKSVINVNNPEQFHSYKNKLEKMMEEKKVQYEQIGNIEKIQKEWIDRLGKDDKLTDVMLRRTNIIGATCLGIASLPATNHIVFDWVIIDEAGRATPPELLVPITLGRKIVLVGDHKQLPPLVDQQIQNLNLNSQKIRVKDLEVSLFEELMSTINKDCVGTLKEQYRMHPAIGNLVSSVFYEGTLESKTKIEERFHGYRKWKTQGVVWLSTTDHPEKYENVVRQSKSHSTYLNRLEARTIFETLVSMEQEFFGLGITKEVGIITGYQAQKTELKKLLDTEYKDKFRNLQIEINTVDAFQGRETDFIFYSVVRSNKDGKIGFLSDARRLNVALSRARDLLVIVGDHISVTKEEFFYREQANPFIKVVEYIKNNPQLCVLERIVSL